MEEGGQNVCSSQNIVKFGQNGYALTHTVDEKLRPSMRNEHTTTHPASSLLLALDLLRAEGHDAQSCLKGTGLCVEDLVEESRTVTLQQETVFYRNLLRLAQDPCIGLRLGQSYLPQHYGLFGYALLSAATGHQALNIATDFGHHLSYTWFQMSFAVAGDCARFEFRERIAIDSEVKEMLFDRDCAAFYVSAVEVLRRQVALSHIRLPHDGHGRRPTYEEHFGCPVTFNHPTAVIEFPRFLLDSPLPFRDEEASRQLARQCRLMLSKVQRHGTVAEEIRGLLIGCPGNFPDIEWIAKKLASSVRTLRRRLSEENTSYQSILDEVRFGLAREYLSETDRPLHEIAALLGYSEPGNFTHAFKRWSGITPNAFRKMKEA